MADLTTGVKEMLEATKLPSAADERDAARAERDATFQLRRDEEFIHDGELIPTADPGSQNLLAALGHWAEWDYGTTPNHRGASRIRREQAGGPEDVTDQRLAANEIHNHYMIQERDDLSTLQEHDIDDDTLLDLSSADSRVQVLDNLVQNIANNAEGEKRCAASSLLGAAVLGGGERGTEGISALLDAMTKNASPDTLASLEGDENTPGVLSEIRKKIASGEQLSTGDMHLIQRELYTELDANETRDANARLMALNEDPEATDEQKAEALKALESAGGAGIQADTLKKFIGNSHALQQMMKDNDMGISFIKNDPNERKSNHAVLTLGHGRDDGAYTVYDPQFRDDGQIITDEAELEMYRRAEATYIAP